MQKKKKNQNLHNFYSVHKQIDCKYNHLKMQSNNYIICKHFLFQIPFQCFQIKYILFPSR